MNVIIFGPPLAGKGTQSKKIIENFGLTHLSTGDVLRAEKKENTELGKKAEQFSKNGLLVPDDLVMKIVERFYNLNSGKGLLFDGYPRNVDQAKHLLNFLNADNDKIDFIIYLKVSKNILLERAEKRALEENRKDDADKNTVITRINEFSNFTIPAVEYIKQTGVTTIEIDGNQSREEIFELINKNLK
ncbi:Adenylate kinase [Tenacibaculum sp. MAR_2009_124]|uniref:adenylate kinase family protein n=1 Tax=Tenacibaculum sp. MAR_2009_124 TaxID=1250059 RepID=UPI0008961390|nr:nucleoside monophosphate kinase [Tenacibaculum sp. MAR_2009_124]SEB41829.1 Adenylate kinase [Tenacibaculum sp. MAR_2009_124]